GRRQPPGARDEQRRGTPVAHPRRRAALSARADAHRGRSALRRPLRAAGAALTLRAVAQRVSSARIRVDGEEVAALGDGLLALVGIGGDDTDDDARELARKLVHLRVFADAEGRMNRSLLEIGGGLGLVSQFTLFGD